jgi:hypothetical protein
MGPGHEPADARRRDEELVVVDRTVEQLKRKSVWVRRSYESMNTPPVAFFGRGCLGGDSGFREFSLGELQGIGVGQLPSGEASTSDPSLASTNTRNGRSSLRIRRPMLSPATIKPSSSPYVRHFSMSVTLIPI